MTETQVLITITAGTPIPLTATHIMACKVSAQLLSGTGPLAYVGGLLLNKSTKAGMSGQLTIGASGNPGASFNKEDQQNCNTIDTSTILFDGDHSGDQILATYSQA